MSLGILCCLTGLSQRSFEMRACQKVVCQMTACLKPLCQIKGKPFYYPASVKNNILTVWYIYVSSTSISNTWELNKSKITSNLKCGK